MCIKVLFFPKYIDTDSEDEEGDEVGRKTKIGKKKKGYSSHKGMTEDFTTLPDEPQELDEDLKEVCILVNISHWANVVFLLLIFG